MPALPAGVLCSEKIGPQPRSFRVRASRQPRSQRCGTRDQPTVFPRALQAAVGDSAGRALAVGDAEMRLNETTRLPRRIKVRGESKAQGRPAHAHYLAMPHPTLLCLAYYAVLSCRVVVCRVMQYDAMYVGISPYHHRLVGERCILVPYEACMVPRYHGWMQDPGEVNTM